MCDQSLSGALLIPASIPSKELAQAHLEALGLRDDLHHAPRAIGDVVGVQLVGN